MTIPAKVAVPSAAIVVLLLLSTYTFYIWYSTSIQWADHVLKDRPTAPADTPTAPAPTAPPEPELLAVSLPPLPTIPSILGGPLPKSIAKSPVPAPASTTDDAHDDDDDDDDEDADADMDMDMGMGMSMGMDMDIPMFTPLRRLAASSSS